MRMTCDGLLNKGMMKRLPSVPFQIRNRVDIAGRNAGVALAMTAIERKSVPAILRGVEFDNIR